MRSIFICFVSVLRPFETRGCCILTRTELSCRDTNYTGFIQAFYEHSTKIDSISSSFKITIRDSTFEQIEYIPNLPSISRNSTIALFTIQNSSLEDVKNNAFEELDDLKYLDLSCNKLRNIHFVQDLPLLIEVLILTNNNITCLNDMFGKLKGLGYLDLSYNRITILDFRNVFWVQTLNFSHNRIETVIPSTIFSKIHELDLSHNNIITFSEVEIMLSFRVLILSYNKLKSVVLAQGDKEFLGLAGTSINQLSVNKMVKIDEVDLSSSKKFLDFTNMKIIPKQQLLLKNSKTEILNESTLNVFNNFRKFKPYKPRIDLSNSSIKDIYPHYFEGLQTVLLNLSNNHILLLKDNVFSNSLIGVLDLSNSNIERIKNTAFKNMVAEKIRLASNKLEIINNIFNEAQVMELDLSFNRFKILENYTFTGCRGLVFLNLDNCLIERIEPEAFSGLDKLQNLTLAHNKLFILEANSFNNLPIRTLNLKGNKIDTIRSRAFNNLFNLKELDLSNVGLCNVESYSFNNLTRVENVDLSHNNITIIPHYLFISMGSLRTVLLEGNNITTLNPFSIRLKLHTLTLSFKGIFKINQILNSNIRYLHIKDSKIDILKNNCFGGLYNLIELHFNGSHVFVAAGALNNLYSLKFLDSQSLFKHTKTIEQHTFRDLRSLEHLDLSKLSLQYLETKAFFGMSRLKTLLLASNNLTELQGSAFYGLHSLKVLDLTNCNIKKCDKESFVGVESLEILHLEYNNLSTVESQLLFGSLSNLLDLHLEHNNISSLHIMSFFGLTNLLRLHLQNNNLEAIPIGVFQYLPTLKVLNLSNNAIQLLKTGALSNLKSLQVLDLSDNQLVNLEYVDIFFSLQQLEVVQFDGNHLKLFDFRRLLINLKKIRYVGISYNKWKCDNLSYIIESFNNRSIYYKPQKPVFDEDNIDGIGCVDICKFIYCSHENVEQHLHYY